MKKISILFALSLFLWTGCGVKKKELDLDQIKRELLNLTIDEIDFESLAENLEEDLSEFKVYSVDEITEYLGITEEQYENFFFCTSLKDAQTYIVIEPKEKEMESIKEKIESYWTNRYENEEEEETKQIYWNRLEQQYGNYLIYIAGKDTTKKLDQIKENKKKIFPDMIKLEKLDLETTLKIDVSILDSYLFAVTNKLDTVEQFIILKSKQEEEMESAVHNYFENLETEWKNKDEAKYNLLKKRMETKIGDYLIYLVSEDNAKVYQMIESYYQ